MAEESKSSPKPERADVSLPKVLVHQPSESDKGEDSAIVDEPNGIVHEENELESNQATKVEPSPETGETSSAANKTGENEDTVDYVEGAASVEVEGNGDHEGGDAESSKEIKEDNPTKLEITALENNAVGNTVSQNEKDEKEQEIATATEDMDVVPDGDTGQDEEHGTAEKSLHEGTGNSEPMTVVADSQEVFSDHPKQIPGRSSPETGQVESPEDLPATKDPEKLVSTTPEKSKSNELHLKTADAAEDQDTSKTTEDPRTTEKIDSEERESSSKTPDGVSREKSTEGIGKEKEEGFASAATRAEADYEFPTPEPTVSTPLAKTDSSETVSIQEELDNKVADLAVDDAEEKSDVLLKMVANGETELISTVQTPVPENVQSQGTEIHDNKLVNPNHIEKPDTPVEGTHLTEGLKDSTPEVSHMAAPTPVANEASSVSSDERPDGENHYDASVSGNEEESPEKPKETETSDDTNQKSATTTENLDSLQELITEERNSENNVHEERFAAEQHPTPVLTPSSLDKSPKTVKFSSDTKPNTDSDSESDNIVEPHIESRSEDRAMREDLMSPDPSNPVRTGDLEEYEGKESPLEDGTTRQVDSSSKMSNHSDGSESQTVKSVVEHDRQSDSPDPATASQDSFEEYRKKKENETEELNVRIQELQDEINKLAEEKAADRQKVEDMSLQIRRMTDDNSENVKTINNYEQKIRTLEDQVEKCKASLALHEQQRNGTANAVEKGSAKKSSVCVIL